METVAEFRQALVKSPMSPRWINADHTVIFVRVETWQWYVADTSKVSGDFHKLLNDGTIQTQGFKTRKAAALYAQSVFANLFGNHIEADKFLAYDGIRYSIQHNGLHLEFESLVKDGWTLIGNKHETGYITAGFDFFYLHSSLHTWIEDGLEAGIFPTLNNAIAAYLQSTDNVWPAVWCGGSKYYGKYSKKYDAGFGLVW